MTHPLVYYLKLYQVLTHMCYILQIFLGRVIGRYRIKTVKITDRRVRMMNEIINCIKLIKMYSWESSFASEIGEFALHAKAP